MFSSWKFGFIILAMMSVQTRCKPLESTDEQLTDMEKDLASILSDDQQEDTVKKEEKIPASLLEDLKPGQKDGHQTNPIDKTILQGFSPRESTGEDSNSKSTDDLLSEDDIRQKQKRLFELLSQKEESEDNTAPNSLVDEIADDNDKIPEDLLRDLESKSRREQPKKPASTWLEPDENDDVKKEILTSILMDELMNRIKEKTKRGERIPDKVIDLLRKYNAKRFV